MSAAVFHFAFHVNNLEQACDFYGDVLGCTQGRRSKTWVDFNFFGHQLSLHLGTPFAVTCTGKVAGKQVPMPHFGVILPQAEWQALAQRLTEMQIDFVLKPSTRYAGQPGEQSTMFFCDPSGNPIEIKGFVDMSGVFAR
ncbi:Putative ring-cleaving dioxygenase [hydrothermal vent metagenome]|uniref:Ring-cleaving dioxygenase n=1 Tax=hydrothermal vent metagenome TaxID=652676 RepID=A0A3B0S1K0_9ZZZZ